jgi:hypothetical protein
MQPAELRDQPQPRLIWADIEDLVVDHRYQRDITGKSRAAIQRIADQFDWRRFQPILVAPVAGNRMAIVDGQHRAHAAKLAGLDKIPAMMVPMSLAEQAAGFAAVNRDLVRVSPLQIYRAELAAQTPWAVQCHQVVHQAGCHLATANHSYALRRPGTVYAVGLIRKMVERGEAEAVTAGLYGIRRSEAGASAEMYENGILSVWLPAVAQNQRFLKLDLGAAFDAIDVEDVVERAHQTARTGGGTAKHLATAEIVQSLKHCWEEEAQG